MKTKQAIYLLVTLLMFALNPLRLQATHAAGMELTYTHLSGSVYKFRCVFYRDCMGIASTGSLAMHASSLSCGIDQYFALDIDTSQTTIIPITCPSASTFCSGGTVPGIEKIVYEKEITLSGQCSDWLFEVTMAARSSSITTLQNPGGDDLYVAARLNNSIAENNSPQFTNDPIVFVCKDQDFHYNLGMFDADGDSISYELVGPRTDVNTYAVYNPGYNSLQPLSSTPPVTFNDSTGDLFIHSTAIEVTVFVYEIKDWRNGELMGIVTRDVIMYTVSCGNNPTATGMNGTSQQFLYVFPNDTVCFDVLSDDIDVNDTVTMTWNQTIPNATFVTSGIPHPTGTFCWTPTLNDVRTQPYMFTVMVNDNTCPVENACIYSYFIYVTQDSSLVFAGIDSREMDHEFILYPNPSDGIFETKCSEKIVQVKIFDQFGNCILSTSQEKIDLTSVAPGVYLAEFQTAGNRTKRQFILRK